MSRYIDVDEFLANESEAYMKAQIALSKQNADKTIDPDRYINMLVHKKILMLMADTPHIDIVRCKECKWRGEEIESGNPYHWCRLVGVGYEVDDTHFCSYGEREGE